MLKHCDFQASVARRLQAVTILDVSKITAFFLAKHGSEESLESVGYKLELLSFPWGYQGMAPTIVINGAIGSPISRVRTPDVQLFSAIYRGPMSLHVQLVGAQ